MKDVRQMQLSNHPVYVIYSYTHIQGVNKPHRSTSAGELQLRAHISLSLTLYNVKRSVSSALSLMPESRHETQTHSFCFLKACFWSHCLIGMFTILSS